MAHMTGAHGLGAYRFSEITQSSHENQILMYSMLEKMKQKYHRIQKFHFWVYTQKICKQNFRQLHSKIHSSPKVATSPMHIEG